MRSAGAVWSSSAAGAAGFAARCPMFGRIWVDVLTPCGVHGDRVAEPLLLAVDEDVTPFLRPQPA